jgi:hypothetical protein
VISVGLLGLASLLPVGLVTIFQATKMDRAGNCGRMAMREVAVRRMLDSSYWFDLKQNKYVNDPNYNGSKPWCDPTGIPTMNMPASFIIDPLGANNGMNLSFGSGGTITPRISLNYIPPGSPLADAIFRGGDDIIATLPENMTPVQPPGRPIPVMDASNKIASKGDYSWFLTVTPSPTTPTRFEVSVVVCFGRTLNPTANQVAEAAFPVASFADTVVVPGLGVNAAQAGGTIQLSIAMKDGAIGGVPVRENGWVALVRGSSGGSTPSIPAAGYVQWYRVAAIGDSSDTSTAGGAQLTLAGPDWMAPQPGKDMLVVLGQEVVGVYTTTIDLDTDATWKN